MVKRTAACLFMLTYLSGCSQWGLGLETKNELPPPPPPPKTAYPFSDIPVPFNFSKDHSKSFIYESGTGTAKVGRLVYSGWENIDSVLIFYQNQMLNKGWTLVNSIKHDNHVLNYEKSGWLSTITLHYSLGRTYVEIQAGPK